MPRSSSDSSVGSGGFAAEPGNGRSVPPSSPDLPVNPKHPLTKFDFGDDDPVKTPLENILMAWLIAGLALFALSIPVAGIVVLARRRNLHNWIGSYYRVPRDPAVSLGSGQPMHVFIAVCDHYEPEWNRPSREVSLAKVDRWVKEYPERFGRFQDSRGRAPQHTFFFPQDEYRPEYLDRLAGLCRAGYGDVEIHLHHDGDTPESLTEKLSGFREDLHQRHGLLRTDPVTGRVIYSFIHGNWALCNSRPDGRWCGVNDELTVLQQTGCYADFTMPSAPSDTQTPTINSIYYARDRGGCPASHAYGIPAQVGKIAPADHLLLVQGPLLPDWSDRKFGVLPRVENGDLHGGRPPTWERFLNWLKAGVHVTGRPDWIFVKLHTHGCNDANLKMWLGPDAEKFHADLAEHSRNYPNLRYYYVTAWEMAQLVHQAEAGLTQPDFDALQSTSLSSTLPGSPRN